MSDKESKKEVVRKPAFTERDFMAQKTKAEKLSKELERSEKENTRLKKAQELWDMSDISDDNIKDIKQFILDRESEQDDKDKALDKREADITEKEESFAEREKESSVSTLAEQYGVKVEEIKDSADPEKEAMKLALERGTKGGEENPAEETFEEGQGSITKKAFADMTDEEFEKEEKAMLAAQAKKLPS